MLRGQRTSFLFGVRVPTLVPLLGPVPEELKLHFPDALELGYAVNFRYAGGEAYECEKVFWSSARLSGRFSPKIHSGYGAEDSQSEFPPDLGESEAMLAMVRRLLHSCSTRDQGDT